jgi:DNA-damage-inducible protein D
MKKELIQQLFHKFEQARYLHNNIECWSARELQDIFGYTKWANFVKVIEKAKTACESSGVDILDHFADVGKMVPIGSGVDRKIEDFAISRYACYLVAQNGDPGKPEAMHLHSPGFKPRAM